MRSNSSMARSANSRASASSATRRRMSSRQLRKFATGFRISCASCETRRPVAVSRSRCMRSACSADNRALRSTSASFALRNSARRSASAVRIALNVSATRCTSRIRVLGMAAPNSPSVTPCAAIASCRTGRATRADNSTPNKSARMKAPSAEMNATRRSSGRTASSSESARVKTTRLASPNGAVTTRRRCVPDNTSTASLNGAATSDFSRIALSNSRVAVVSSVVAATMASPVLRMTTSDRVRPERTPAAPASIGASRPAAPIHLPSRTIGASATF